MDIEAEGFRLIIHLQGNICVQHLANKENSVVFVLANEMPKAHGETLKVDTKKMKALVLQ